MLFQDLKKVFYLNCLDVVCKVYKVSKVNNKLMGDVPRPKSITRSKSSDSLVMQKVMGYPNLKVDMT